MAGASSYQSLLTESVSLYASFKLHIISFNYKIHFW